MYGESWILERNHPDSAVISEGNANICFGTGNISSVEFHDVPKAVERNSLGWIDIEVIQKTPHQRHRKRSLSFPWRKNPWIARLHDLHHLSVIAGFRERIDSDRRPVSSSQPPQRREITFAIRPVIPLIKAQRRLHLRMGAP
jgi:hypothetical protein